MYGEFGQMGMFHGGGMLFWLFIVIVAIVLGMNLFKKNTDTAKYDTPMDILKLRYAKGEITKEEFIDMKQELS